LRASLAASTFAILLVLPSLSSAATCPDLPSGSSSNWTEQERWVWQEICEGHEANLQQYSGPQHDLSQRFIETILFAEPYRNSIPRQSVRIVGARFPERVDLSQRKLDGDLSLTSSQFDGRQDGEAVNLVGSEIRGSLTLNGSTASSHVNMDSLHAGTVSMNGVNFPSLWLATARIGTQLSVNDSTVAGLFQMNNVEVGTDLFLLNSTLTEVVLRSAKVGGMLAIEGPRRRADPVAESQHCHNNTRPRPRFRHQSVDLAGATLGTLSLGSLCYGPVDAHDNWGAGSELILTGASVHALRDGLCRDDESNCAEDTWPEHLKLIGFTYQTLTIFDYDRELDMAARPAAWWTAWLRRQAYSQHPYDYLASNLMVDYKDKAEDILYAGKNRELANTSFPGNINLWLEWLLIGYGYRTRYAVMWAGGFIILGAMVLRLSGEGTPNKMPFGIAFSFDMLLPIVRLREYHYTIDLKGWARYYFYFHKLMGYVLASFLIAGLSGWTK
jgi:hypothetical protein